jgi:hypothetical protein
MSSNAAAAVLATMEETTYEEIVEWFNARYDQQSLALLKVHGLLFSPEDLWAYRNKTIKGLRKLAKKTQAK